MSGVHRVVARGIPDQQLGYLGVSVEVNVGSPGGVKGEGIGQRVLGVNGAKK